MMDQYSKARKEGLRAYSLAVQNNQDPYLPVLEEKVPNLSQLNRRKLGVMSIPLDRVAGSVSQGRSFAFANNFYPILEGGSEFAGKWNRLYESVAEQGVNQPVTVLEYMGYYYVQEGNKRVSVSLCMGSSDIDADVTRVIPVRTEEPENIAYFEYCVFSRETGLYHILFTHPGDYQKLMALPGIRAGETWTEDEIMNLRSVWNTFRMEYLSLPKEKQTQSTGDAFLSYLIAFGYETVRQDGQKKTQERVRLMAQEFEAGEKVKLVMEPDEQPKTGPALPLISSLFRPGRIRAAFLYSRSTEESAWEYWHEVGRQEIEKKLGDRVETTARVIGSRAQFKEAIDPLLKEGYTAFFATTPVMLNSCIEPALEHPEVRFLCCSLLSSYTNIRTYYIRFYEAKFLLGMTAGILSRNGKIGYIADYPIYGMPSAVNAFALGARMVNPDAKVYLNWTSAGFFDPKNPFEDPEIRVICNRDITAPTFGSREVGLHLRENGNITNMAALIPQWGPFYQMMVERQLAGSLPSSENKNAATHYWWGMGSNILDVALSARIDPYVRRLINEYRAVLCNGTFFPFEGELRDQAGTLRCEADCRLTPAEILCMDYLLDNVVGELPALDQLVESARPLVKLQGIREKIQPEMSSFSWDR